MPVRTIPLDPDAPISPPHLDPQGRPRWIVPFDRSFLVILYALEFSSILILAAVFISTRQDLWLMLLVVGFLLVSPWLMYRFCRLKLVLEDHHLRWVFLPFWRGRIPYDAIENAETCTYSPLADFGGWGVRGNRRYFALISGGTRGVLITRHDKKRQIVVSCPQAESLAVELLRRAVGEQEARETGPAPV